MPPLSRSARLLDRADAALISAIELYNKPDFRYREEAFAILALNAWELLLKAKLLHEHGNDLRALYEYEHHMTRTGGRSRREYVRRNRAGNIRTAGMQETVNRLADVGTQVPPAVLVNLEALAEVRDNAVHFVNVGPKLERLVLEVGTAAVKNFVELSRRWLGHDLSRYSLYLMPIGFVTGRVATAIRASGEEEQLIAYLSALPNGPVNADTGLHVALQIDITMQRTPGHGGVAITNDPNAPLVRLDEEDIRRQYPWDYADLVNRLRNRYVDFKANGVFHEIRKPLMSQERYVRSRFLDPGNPLSSRKDFYNPNIVQEFDRHYVRSI